MIAERDLILLEAVSEPSRGNSEPTRLEQYEELLMDEALGALGYEKGKDYGVD